MSEHNVIDHPPHYTSHPSGVEVIELTRHLPFTVGNAVKYVLRRDFKKDPEEDLGKALWYINDAIRNKTTYRVPKGAIARAKVLCDAEPNDRVRWFIEMVMSVHDGHGRDTTAGVLRGARSHLRALREEYQ